MFTNHHLLRVLTVATLASAPAVAHAQQAFFSAQGGIDTAGDQVAFDLDLSRPVTSAEDIRFETFTFSGGTNAAGDTISASSFDSTLNLQSTSSSAVNVSNNNGGVGNDALLAFSGIADSGGTLPTPLPAEAYTLTLNELGNNAAGPFAVDLVGPANALSFSGPSATSTARLESLAFGTIGTGTAVATYNVGSNDQINGAVTVGATGSGLLSFNDGDDTLTAGGLVRANAGGTITLNSGTLNANGGVLIDGGTLRGNGTINATNGVTNAGTVVLDSTFDSGFFGDLTINGDYTQTASGRLEVGRVEVLSGDAEFPFDFFAVDGAASLAGELAFTADASPFDAFGDIELYRSEFIFDTDTGITGTFDTVTDHILGDGTALAVTYSFAAAFATRALLGDANLDGFIGQADLDVVLLNFGQSNLNGNNDGVSFVTGDFTGDGFVGQADLDAVLLNFGDSTPLNLDGSPLDLNTIPEPTSLALLGLGGVALTTRRRRA